MSDKNDYIVEEEKEEKNKKVNKILTFKEKMIVLYQGVMKELTHNISWTPWFKLWQYIKQFTIVAFISVLALFIMDNFIVYCLRFIYN